MKKTPKAVNKQRVYAMAKNGYHNNRIAETLGVSPSEIRDIVEERWPKERQRRELREHHTPNLILDTSFHHPKPR